MSVTNFGALQVSDGYSAPVDIKARSIQQFNFWLAGAQTARTMAWEIIASVAGEISDVRAYVETAPTGASFIVDVMLNGVTIFTTSANRPTILAAANASSTTLPDVTSFAAGDRIRIDVIQIGAGTAGSNLAVSIAYKRYHNT